MKAKYAKMAKTVAVAIIAGIITVSSIPVFADQSDEPDSNLIICESTTDNNETDYNRPKKGPDE